MKKIRYYLEYLGALGCSKLVRILPHGFLAPLARGTAFCVRLAWPLSRLVRANIRAAMPELERREVARIANESFFHMFNNFFEFVWLNSNPERICRCYYPQPESRDRIKRHLAAGERIIFINPHLGSWEASGVMAPFYTGIDMAAIAKPVSNPYLNRLLNSGGREKIKGLRIIFTRGAVKTALRMLREGWSLGTLIDQNTRVRDGGIFIDFFGLPVSSSAAPALLKRYCDAHDVPTVLIFAASLRMSDGMVHTLLEELPKPFDEYPDDRAVIQEIMAMSERYVRRYPEQYLWLYRRFRNIPPDCPEELRKRYPYYAAVPKPSFFRKRRAAETSATGPQAQ